MSNRTTGRRGSSASTNGWSASRLAPMPWHSSSGAQPGFPARTETRMARPPTVRILIRSPGPARRGVSMVTDVGSGRVADRRQPAATGLGRGRLLLAAALGQPARVVRPPGPVAGLGTAQPLLGIFRALLGHLVPGLVVAPLVDSRNRGRPPSSWVDR